MISTANLTYPYIRVSDATGERYARTTAVTGMGHQNLVLGIEIVAARTRHSASPPNLPQLLNYWWGDREGQRKNGVKTYDKLGFMEEQRPTYI